MLQTISLVVHGKVQGVFFRHSARQKALQLGVTGIVRNNPDGSVGILATGEPGSLEQLIAWSKSGPPAARVQQVEVKQMPLQSFNSFSVLH